MAENKNKMSFEDAVSKLEDIVALLEGGELTLDDSISRFEEAIGLVKICSEKLECAKQRVKILTKTADGAVTDMPFGSDGDEA